MSRIPTAAQTTNVQTASDRADRTNLILLIEDSVGNDGNAEARGGEGFQPSSPSDVGLDEPADATPDGELGQSVAEKFGIDEKHLYRKP